MENKIDSIMITHKDRFIRFGYEEDRDYNASINLRDAKVYKIAL